MFIKSPQKLINCKATRSELIANSDKQFAMCAGRKRGHVFLRNKCKRHADGVQHCWFSIVLVHTLSLFSPLSLSPSPLFRPSFSLSLTLSLSNCLFRPASVTATECKSFSHFVELDIFRD